MNVGVHYMLIYKNIIPVIEKFAIGRFKKIVTRDGCEIDDEEGFVMLLSNHPETTLELFFLQDGETINAAASSTSSDSTSASGRMLCLAVIFVLVEQFFCHHTYTSFQSKIPTRYCAVSLF